MAEFSSRTNAAKQCGVSTTSVIRNINRVFTSCTYLGSTVSLLFVSNMKDSKVPSFPVILEDTLHNKYSHFDSLEKVKQALNMPVT